MKRYSWKYFEKGYIHFYLSVYLSNMKKKWLFFLLGILFCVGLGVLYKFLPLKLVIDSVNQEHLPSSSEELNTEKQDVQITITQDFFTGTDFHIHPLGALDDRWIARAVGFYDTFWEYFDEDQDLPSGPSCANAETERLKQPLRWWKCRWHELHYPPFSFIFTTPNPLAYLENGKLYIKDQDWREKDKYEITQYSLGEGTTFNDIIEHHELWLDQKYCLKPYYFWDIFKHWDTSWIGGLGKKLNALYDANKLHIYNIHEIFEGECSNNNPGVVLYVEWSQKFYTVIANPPAVTFMDYEGIYSTHFSVDLL